ncbi:hypothetical protein AYO08_21955 [Pseudomonas putida]|jgi:hypothetical protein|nr:hypothetical protein RK21_02928 [Pseudomonas plecoglossicida]KRP83210.1 hypothetical protein TX25_29465 [Pseudomonas lactis]KYC16589.1 hypothetical protein WM94_23455 [Pseudomonas sp. ABFPK]OAS27588.1 hypothetical protein AYO08_21955 [Pseudomonas putida]
MPEGSEANQYLFFDLVETVGRNRRIRAGEHEENVYTVIRDGCEIISFRHAFATFVFAFSVCLHTT